MKFTIAIEVGTEKTAVGIVVPDLPGCFSAGDTVEQAFDNAREIIDAFCKILAEEGRKLPVPKSMSKWQADKKYSGWAWGIIDVSVEKYFTRAEKINITVPANILERIDQYAVKIGETRSGFLVKAAEEAMRKAV